MHPNDTNRLMINGFQESDAAFVLALLNSNGWLEYIGYRGIHTLDDARAYISDRLTVGNDSGYGCYVIRRKADHTAIGLVSLLQRDYLDAPDIGYALLPEFMGNGYAFEATGSLLQHCIQLGIRNVYAIISAGNSGSVRLIRKLEFHFQRSLEVEREQVYCYEKQLLQIL